MEEVREFAKQIVDNVETVIIGKREALELLMVALLCEGHVLLEDVPGVGKTMLARALAASLGIDFKRLQCTPDLLPNDVTGVSIFDQGSQPPGRSGLFRPSSGQVTENRACFAVNRNLRLLNPGAFRAITGLGGVQSP